MKLLRLTLCLLIVHILYGVHELPQLPEQAIRQRNPYQQVMVEQGEPEHPDQIELVHRRRAAVLAHEAAMRFYERTHHQQAANHAREEARARRRHRKRIMARSLQMTELLDNHTIEPEAPHNEINNLGNTYLSRSVLHMYAAASLLLNTARCGHCVASSALPLGYWGIPAACCAVQTALCCTACANAQNARKLYALSREMDELPAHQEDHYELPALNWSNACRLCVESQYSVQNDCSSAACLCCLFSFPCCCSPELSMQAFCCESGSLLCSIPWCLRFSSLLFGRTSMPFL